MRLASGTAFAALALGFTILAGVAQAGTEFGTDEQVRKVLADFVALTKEKGTDTAAASLKDRGTPFGGAQPGMMIWVDNKMAAHNKYPDLSGVDFATMQDLRGRFIVKEFTEAADKGGDYTLNYWPHYTNEKEYEYHCFSTWVEKPRVMATACR
ncbi:MAG TPA: cache domain-containing protein [Azospirillaceae bacterium]|nr:cache domain-containing protein [Azospirillaceae bacterium]